MVSSTALRPAAGRAAQADPAGNPQEVVAVIRASDRDGLPPPRVPSSRTIARLRAKAEAAAQEAVAAAALVRQVQPGLRPPPGRLFAADIASLLLRGPRGGIGTSERMARTLGPLAVGGRHQPEALMAAGGWKDEPALHEALAGLGPKLQAIGLRVCKRKAGLRMAKARPS